MLDRATTPSDARDAHAPTGRFPCFDGLRALAALSVFAFHSAAVMFRSDPSYVPAVRWFGRLGFFGVAVFFVISGFLLYRPYAEAALSGRPGPRLRAFWTRRLARIFPGYWLALVFVILVLDQFTVGSVGQGLTYFGLVQNYRGGGEALGIGVAWTLGIELSFYFVLPGLAWVLRRLPGVRGQLLGLVVLALIGIGSRYWWLYGAQFGARDTSWLSLRSFFVWLPAYLDWFALGMAMAVAYAWQRRDGGLPRPVSWLGELPIAAWLLALVCFWGVVELSGDPFPAWTPAERFWRWGLTGLAGALFVLPAVFGPQDRGVIRRLLRTRVLVALGVVSYGIYLYHLPLWVAAEGWSWMPASRLLQVAIVLGLTVLAATASYWAVERPVIRWVRRRAPLGGGAPVHASSR